MDYKIKDMFDSYVSGYEKLLSCYYPAHGSTGFMEVNQVVQFCKALQEYDPDCFYWLEAPLPRVGNSSPRIDGVVFAPTLEAVFYIEAKRIDNPNEKYDQIVQDVTRLLKDENRQHIRQNLKDSNVYLNEYLVVLADVWLETGPKKGTPFWWTENDFPIGLNGKESKKYRNTKTFKESISGVVDWDVERNFIHNFTEEGVENYCLMLGSYQIRSFQGGNE